MSGSWMLQKGEEGGHGWSQALRAGYTACSESMMMNGNGRIWVGNDNEDDDYYYYHLET